MPASTSPLRAQADLFLVSALILFLELSSIRWFPAHVLFLTFFTNTVLLACFLGMSLGCLTASRARNHLAWTPIVLVVALGAGTAMEDIRFRLLRHLDVGHQSAPEMVFFGTEKFASDPTRIPIPIELVAGIFFVLIALVMIGPGQLLGRLLTRVPNRVRAYTLNILGSAVGVGLFTLASWARLSPFWWFAAISALLGYFLLLSDSHAFVKRRAGPLVLLVIAVVLASIGSLPSRTKSGASVEDRWSPYYRIQYVGEPKRVLTVNLIGHQQMIGRAESAPAYELPHLFRRDSGQKRFENVLVIGAGSGNDVSRALEWGARHVDAVEIDPVIQGLGLRDHPDRPYQDSRVSVHIDDGRHFLRATSGKYDLVEYALVDSLVLHSGYSNIRLESYLFTRRALEDAKRHLEPGGWLVMYNFFRQGWIVDRLRSTAREVFGSEPLVLTLPFQSRISAEHGSSAFTMIICGQPPDLDPLRTEFRDQPQYWLHEARPAGAWSPNGFSTPAADERRALVERAGAGQVPDWLTFGLATIDTPAQPVRIATDDWPFLYLREPLVPSLTLRGILVMGFAALLLIAAFGGPRLARGASRLDGAMFFLGGGFMLLETKAVVQMALLLGGTWIVNSVVFLGILTVILASNLFVLRVAPRHVSPYYVGLFSSLVVGFGLPIDLLVGSDRVVQMLVASVSLLTPIFFAGVVFAVSFSRTPHPERALGFNVAGAVLGGWLENLSMLVGLAALSGIALAIYGLAGAFTASRGSGTTAPSTPP